MLLSEIRKGMKVYQYVKIKLRSETRPFRIQENVWRILEINGPNYTVLASQNGFPAQWCAPAVYKHWQIERTGKLKNDLNLDQQITNNSNNL